MIVVEIIVKIAVSSHHNVNTTYIHKQQKSVSIVSGCIARQNRLNISMEYEKSRIGFLWVMLANSDLVTGSPNRTAWSARALGQKTPNVRGSNPLLLS